MITVQSQVKVNLPLPLKEYLESKARKFGVPVAGYIKHLILKDIEEMRYPVSQASDKTENAYQEAIKEIKAGKTITVSDLDKFFKNL